MFRFREHKPVRFRQFPLTTLRILDQALFGDAAPGPQKT